MSLARFRFPVAVAYAAKPRFGVLKKNPAHTFQRHFNEEEGTAGSMWSSVQKKRADIGDDSFFYEKWQQPKSSDLHGSMALAVTDGVGGLAKQGVDPAHLSHSLCEEMGYKFGLAQSQKSILSASNLLEDAFNELTKRPDDYVGSTTATVGIVSSSTGIMTTANLGDSGYYIFRKGRVLRYSKPQVITFNTPYQLRIFGTIRSANANPRSKRLSTTATTPNPHVVQIQNTPQDADEAYQELQHGDFVLFATDGLSDNLFLHDILRIVTKYLISTKVWTADPVTNEIEPNKDHRQLEPPYGLVRQLVSTAQQISLDPNYASPFAINLRRALDTVVLGGKPDDITALGFLVERTSAPAQAPVA